MPDPHPRFPLVFSAFSVGLMANAGGDSPHFAALVEDLFRDVTEIP